MSLPHELADLRPRLRWDRANDVLSARPGAAMVSRMNAGTIPDRGNYLVTLGPEGGRLGELDEEMVFETRPGENILLGATTWRVEEITRDRVIVSPAPGEPGKLPFWRGDGPGRPIELGRAIGGFLRDVSALRAADVAPWIEERTPLDAFAPYRAALGPRMNSRFATSSRLPEIAAHSCAPSNTTPTSRPSSSMSRSLTMRTTPLDLVALPYDDTAMKSVSTGSRTCLARSARTTNAPLRIPIISRSLPS